MIVSLEAQGTNAYKRYAMCPAGHLAAEIITFFASKHTPQMTK